MNCKSNSLFAKPILFERPNQYICILCQNTFLCNGQQYCWVFPVEMEYCAGKQSICVVHSKVFVCCIQRYLCNPFKIAFHQAWQEEGCKNIANSAKKMRHKLIRPSGAWILSKIRQNRWLHNFFQKFFWFVDQKSSICNIFLPLLPLILCEKNLVEITRAFVALREFLWDKISED